MECECIEAYEGSTSFYRDKIVTARKRHQCGECGAIIDLGENYEYIFGVSEGDAFTAKTCLPCIEVRNTYFCLWEFTSVWEFMREMYEDISLSDFETFTTAAQQKILEML